MQHDLSALHTWVFNTLQDQIAVIDRAGTIIVINRAWTEFGNENGLSGESTMLNANYFKVLNDSAARGDVLAGDAAQGMLAVVNGERSFYEIEYPCHSPSEQRWFIMRVCRVQEATSDLFVTTTTSHSANSLKNAPNTWPCMIRSPDWLIVAISIRF